MQLKNVRKKLGYFFGKKNAQGFPVRYDAWGRERNVPALRNHDWSEVVNPITRKQVVKWIAELRSGKYIQTTSVLKAQDGDKICSYCCLGVLAESRAKLNANYCEEYDFTDYSFSRNVDDILAEQAGTDEHGFMKYTYHMLPASMQTTYYNLNDMEKQTFSYIADQIEKDFGIV